MEWHTVAGVLSRLGVDTSGCRPSPKKQVMISCPLAPWFHKGDEDTRPSLSVRYGLTPVRWKCFACGEHGKLYELVESFATLAEDADLRTFAGQLMESDVLTLRQEFEERDEAMATWTFDREPVPMLSPEALDPFPSVWHVPQALNYLRDRRVTRAAINAFGLRWDDYKERILFPVTRADGGVVGAVGRIVWPDHELPYFNYFGFESGQWLGGLANLTDRRRLLVVEGFFDLLRVWPWAQELGADVVCSWTSRLSPTHKEFLTGADKTVWIWYDGDTAGNTGWTEAHDLEPRTYGLRRCQLPEGVDPGSLKRSQFENLYKKMEERHE